MYEEVGSVQAVALGVFIGALVLAIFVGLLDRDGDSDSVVSPLFGRLLGVAALALVTYVLARHGATFHGRTIP